MRTQSDTTGTHCGPDEAATDTNGPVSRNFQFTRGEWTEIYNAIDNDQTGGAKDKILEESTDNGDDLTDTDWLEIFVAVKKKHGRLEAELCGSSRLTCEWREDMGRILGELDPIRAQYIGGEA